MDFLCSTISKSIFALSKVKNCMPLAALKSLYFVLIHSRLQYGIESWGNSNNIYKLFRMQKRAIRVIYNTKYRHHTDPLFKINNIMKVSDLYKQRVFMYDLINNNLPTTFKDFSILENANNYGIITRLQTRLYITRPRTTFSSKLPNHNFDKIWNDFNENLQHCISKPKVKLLIQKGYVDAYLSIVCCRNPRCDECIENNHMQKRKEKKLTFYFYIARYVYS